MTEFLVLKAASYQKHFVYWKYLPSGAVGIVTILHERMHQIDLFKDDFVG